jgi:hypothetical protein
VKLIRHLMILVAVLAVPLLAGCDTEANRAERLELESAPIVISGSGPWGSVDLRATSSGVVKGNLPWGSSAMNRNGDRYSGSTPWGSTNLTYVDGQLSGSAPWGHISVRVTETSLRGSLPWGSANLTLNGKVITGSLPWGSVTLTLGDNYKSLNDPDVLLALAALLSDKT